MTDEASMLRSIAGDVAERSEDITGIDLRMVRDPTPLFIIEDLKEAARLMKRPYLIRDLEKLEKRVRAMQYIDWGRSFTQDLTKIGLGLGNVQDGYGMEEIFDE